MIGDLKHPLREASMRDLAVAAFRGPDTARFREAVNEINWRWALAREQQMVSWRNFPSRTGWGDQGLESDGYDASAIEDARQYLATQTLIHELWVLQEAEVAPADLFTSRHTVERVWEVLQREIERGERKYGPLGDLLRVPDALGNAANHLAYWSELALFGRGDRLVQDQLRLAGRMRDDLFESSTVLTREALATLRGPWSLEEHLLNPVGKQYLEQQLPPPWGEVDRLDLTSLTMALGLPRQAVSTAELEQAHSDFTAALQGECQRIIRDDPPAPLDPLGPPYDSPDRRRRFLETMRATDDFLITVLGLATLAADRTVRVDGRPVPREAVWWVLDLHQEGVRSFTGHAGVISVAGLRITFKGEKTIGVTAVVDAGGVRKELDPDALATTLALLEDPQAITGLAKRQVALQQAVTSDPPSDAQWQPREGPALSQRPGTPASRHTTPPLPASQPHRRV